MGSGKVVYRVVIVKIVVKFYAIEFKCHMKYSGYFRRKVDNGVCTSMRDLKLDQAIAQESLVVR